MTSRRPAWLEIAALVSVVAALVLAMTSAPIRGQGDSGRMLFIHVPTIWIAYLAFAVTFITSIAFLVTKSLKWDLVAGSSAEIGVVFTTVAIIGGAIWGKATWNVYWTWDARLTLTAVMLFVYIGYLALRRAIPDPQARARRSSVLGVLGLVQLIPVHFSVVWWRTLHQTNTFSPRGIEMDTEIRVILYAAVIAFTIVYAALLMRRVELAKLDLAAQQVAVAADGPVAGDAVTSPTVGGA